MGSREKNQSDFDLERFVDMFDEALTSDDPRVINALRSLMMVVTLTRPESNNQHVVDRNSGPLRRLVDDVQALNRRVYSIEDEIRRLSQQARNTETTAIKSVDVLRHYPNEKYIGMISKELARDIDQSILHQQFKQGK